MFSKTAGCACPFPPVCSSARRDWTASSSLSYLLLVAKPAASSPHFFLIPVAPFSCSRLLFLWPHRPEKKASRFLPPLQASLGLPCRFLARAWTSASRAAFFPKNQKLPPKANGSRTVAAMKSSPLHGGEKPRTIAPRSRCACAVR